MPSFAPHGAVHFDCRVTRTPDGPRRRHIALTVLAGIVCLAACGVEAQDAVVLRRTNGTEVQLSGIIVDLTGEWLTFRGANNRDEKLAIDRIARWQTARGKAHEAALQAMQAKQWTTALREFHTAAAEDPRPWMRRRIHADISLCSLNAGDIRLAGEHFAIVCQSDPTHGYYNRIPLPWGASSRLDQQASQQAEVWIKDPMPAKRLLGAAWLLQQRRQQSAGALQSLLGDRDPRIVALAESQLWRLQVVVADLETVKRWRGRLQSFPAELRYGPSFVVGQALLRLQLYEDAATAMMRAPIERPEMVQLAAQALLDSATAMERGKQNEDAQRIYQELLSQYPASEPAMLAKERLATGSD